jgi:outer membrane protein
MKKQSIATTLVAAVALCGAGAAHAQAAGSMLVKVGWNKIVPHVESDDLSPPALPGTKIDIESASSLVITAAYMFTDNISMEFLGGLPYKHDIVAAGSGAGAGKIGSVHQISPTVVLQYRFLEAQAPLRPYVGGGLTWARFYDTEGSAALTAVTNPGGSPTTIGSDTAWGGTVEAGVNYKVDSHWFIDAAMLKTWIKTNPTLSTGQTISAKLNPMSFQVSVGYAF